MNSTIAIIETQVSFTVYGKPKPKERPRIGRNGHVYTPKDTHGYEAIVGNAAQSAMGRAKPFLSPVGVDIAVNIPIPLSWPKYKRVAAKDGLILAASGFDVDNLAKVVLDGMNGIAYRDDTQVIRLNIAKQYTHAAAHSVNVTISVFQQGEGA